MLPRNESEEKKPADDKAPTIDLFKLISGLEANMKEVAREVESEDFKEKMEADPIGQGFDLAFGMLFKMMGAMAESVEQSVEQPAKDAAEEKVQEKSAPASPSLAKSGVFASPARSPEVERKVESGPSSPAFRH